MRQRVHRRLAPVHPPRHLGRRKLLEKTQPHDRPLVERQPGHCRQQHSRRLLAIDQSSRRVVMIADLLDQPHHRVTAKTGHFSPNIPFLLL